MGADIYLQSIWSRKPPFPGPVGRSGMILFATGASPPSGPPLPDQLQAFFDEARKSGGYFRSGYNSGDVMWAMGLSWPGTVVPMLDGDYLPVSRARKLIAMIEDRPLTRERVGAHIFEHMTSGVNTHPVTGRAFQMINEVMAAEAGVDVVAEPPPNFDDMFASLNARRDALLTILHKSVELDEPLFCDI
jgi:hypothetical protein